MDHPGQVARNRDLVEYVRAIVEAHIRGVDRRDQPSARTGHPRLCHSVRHVERSRVDGRRADVEPSHRLEVPAPPDVEVSGEPDRVDPDLAHVLGDNALEPDGPKVVVGVGQRRRFHAGIRRIGEARHRRQRGHVVGREGRLAQPDSQAQTVAVHVVRVETPMQQVSERDAKVTAVDDQDPFHVAVTAADPEVLHVNPSGDDRVGARVLDQQ